MKKQTQRQQAVALVAAEMILNRTPIDQMEESISHCCWRFKTVARVWENLVENATTATINSFKRDVLKSAYLTK
jgi:hypothetical protein